MNGKIRFGVDFSVIMLEVCERSSTPIDHVVPIAVPVMKALLVEWELSIDEIEQAAKLFAEGVNADQIDRGQCVQRVANHLKANEEARRRLITHMVTMAYLLDLDYNDAQKTYVNIWGQELNMRKSEIDEFVLKGVFFARYLNQFGKACVKHQK
jgi:hypothetical protein